VKNFLKKTYIKIITKSFKFFEKFFHIHITPVHYFSPIPTTHKLHPKVYDKVFNMAGIDWNVDEQLSALDKIFKKYVHEFIPEENLGLSLVDAFILYAMIREKKPKKMIEIGSGDTTLISLQALEQNAKEGSDYFFQAVEPYPSEKLLSINNDRFQLIPQKIQDIPLETIQSVDLLFIDSSHVSKIDSDVNCEILEIIPQLKKGALIHWHDIVIPANYWKDWVDHGNMFFNESYMVHAFMLFNNSFKILWASRYMKLNHTQTLHQHFPYLKDAHRLTSFWIERTKY